MDAKELSSLFDLAAIEAARFRNGMEMRSHSPLVDYREALECWTEPLPLVGSAPADVILELLGKAEPGLNGMTGPRFFGWVIGGSHPVGVAADMLTSAWGQNSGNHQATPSAAAAETVSAS